MIQQSHELTELGLQSVECIMKEHSSYSRKLATKVYMQLVKPLFSKFVYPKKFWSLLQACTEVSKISCVTAHNDFFNLCVGTIEANLKDPGCVQDFIIEQAWLILINISGRGPLNVLIQEGKLLDLIFKRWEHEGSLYLHEYTWRIMLNFSASAQPLLNHLAQQDQVQAMLFHTDIHSFISKPFHI